ncbi:hypothetical protein EIN_079770 [Entamoeba invadens IP1]|uniref:hypothetical protein n=1 Tax=Entamoeba invadens IP1 TaxID=370355 RepID=UPI0002C3DC4A|nr:hypothetical protein EIN_079770 [Entamoeba invadens IP1]ELP85035.1 hypothetical protein EIN_079770 [Entamoeba invadens IP1]|eukprot:XP_004184381.1 hypothetical protein EIN_079770 [Entamoeba invadens IP1]
MLNATSSIVSSPNSIPSTDYQMQQQQYGVTGLQQYQYTDTQQIAPPQQQVGVYDVQSVIEQLLTFYFSYEEIVADLESKGVAQNLTLYILDQLKQQNPGYFTAYEIRVTVKNQIARFNDAFQRANASQQSDQQTPQNIFADYDAGCFNSFQADQSITAF